jgi:hypothetical protein
VRRRMGCISAGVQGGVDRADLGGVCRAEGGLGDHDVEFRGC